VEAEDLLLNLPKFTSNPLVGLGLAVLSQSEDFLARQGQALEL